MPDRRARSRSTWMAALPGALVILLLSWGTAHAAHFSAAGFLSRGSVLRGAALGDVAQQQVGASYVGIQQNQNLNFTGSTASSGTQMAAVTVSNTGSTLQEVAGSGTNVNQNAASKQTATGAVGIAQAVSALGSISITQTGSAAQGNQSATVGFQTAAFGLQKGSADAKNMDTITQKVLPGSPAPTNVNQQAGSESTAKGITKAEQEVEAETELEVLQEQTGSGQTNQDMAVSVSTAAGGQQEASASASNGSSIMQEVMGPATNVNQSATGSSTASASVEAEQSVSATNEIKIIQSQE